MQSEEQGRFCLGRTVPVLFFLNLNIFHGITNNAYELTKIGIGVRR